MQRTVLRCVSALHLSPEIHLAVQYESMCIVRYTWPDTCLRRYRADGDVAMVLMHMLGLGVPEAGMLGAALVDAGAALLACNAEVALARCAWPQDATCRTLCGAALRFVILPIRPNPHSVYVYEHAVAASKSLTDSHPMLIAMCASCVPFMLCCTCARPEVVP